ncbi:MAG: 50S ribosomal protein L5 [Planctomycetota bacterium]|nr:MAG: 50S ribosomal protein L5 [Planctomycetota bacterium]REK30058.1 MAG: 50S ribosomal protein L5 [Planctomycetota bacterium]REK37700.1 MAG: 50S ribosomal protein L5 [Planctomycetota bacterium]
MARLLDQYRQEILPRLAKELGEENPLALPQLSKIVVSMGVGRSIQDQKILGDATETLSIITGQKPYVTRARRSIAQFKLREGMPIGCAVTLRGRRMYEFLDRLITLVLPRVRDFRGLNPNAFDGNGNYSLGLSEQMVFPEINPDKVKHVHGMNIAVVTTTSEDDHGRLLLREFGMPFQKELSA